MIENDSSFEKTGLFLAYRDGASKSTKQVSWAIIRFLSAKKPEIFVKYYMNETKQTNAGILEILVSQLMLRVSRLEGHLP